MTPEQRSYVLDLIHDGHPYGDIAEEVGFSISAIHKVAQTNGVRRQRAPGSLPVRKILLAYEHGSTVHEIAKQTQSSPSTISKILHAYGADIRVGGIAPRVPIQKIVQLRDALGWSWGSIARSVGLKNCTVRQRYFRAKKRQADGRRL